MGEWTEEIGFVVRNQKNHIIFEHTPGKFISGDRLLGSFCPECSNLYPVSVLSTEEDRTETASSEDEGLSEEGVLKIVLALFVNIAVILAIALCCVCYKYKNLKKHASFVETSEEEKEKKVKSQSNMGTYSDFRKGEIAL